MAILFWIILNKIERLKYQHTISKNRKNAFYNLYKYSFTISKV
jgi:hypothetical protein